MNILKISKRLVDNGSTSPLINILKKNIVSFSIKNSFRIQNRSFAHLTSPYLSKNFFSNKKDQEEKSEKEEKVEEEDKEAKESKEDASNAALNEKYKELKTLYNEQEQNLEQTRKKFHEIKELYLKNIEEIDAIKFRSDREIKNSKDYAITKFAKDLLDVHDNFGRALGYISEKDFKSLPEEEKIETFDDFVNGI